MYPIGVVPESTVRNMYSLYEPAMVGTHRPVLSETPLLFEAVTLVELNEYGP
jgi:hypothetical protein